MSKKIIELLEDAKKEHNDDCILCAIKDTRINDVITLLKQQPLREQPCGCILCICDTEDRCLGCGAKMCEKHKAIGHLPDEDRVYEQQPTAGEFTKKVREDWDKNIFGGIIYELCDRLDRAEATKKDLLEVCKGLMEKADNGSADFDDPAPGSIYLKAIAVIAKAEKERG